jgi:hypothetical protein
MVSLRDLLSFASLALAPPPRALREETTPIPTFPLRGKESWLLPKRRGQGPLPFRGRDRVGVVSASSEDAARRG